MNTVLNTNKIKPNQPLFLGEDIGIAKLYDPRYIKIQELYQDQLDFFWTAKEVPLTKDRSDYKELTDKERFVFNSNIRWQTMVDSTLTRSISQIADYITSSDLEQCVNAWKFFEGIHVSAYDWILRNITNSPEEFFDSILDDKEIVKRADQIKKSYDRLLGKPSDIKTSIFDALISTQITEGLAFYISFACSFFFGYNGKMEGNAKIIKFISRDENLHVAITQTLVKILRDNPEEGFQKTFKDNEQKIYEMYGEAVKNEKGWAEYLFSQGDLLGLNAKILGQYIEWLANARLVSMGYKKIFDQPSNPIKGWLNAYTDSKHNQVAPQETQLNGGYKISARDAEIKEDEFEGFEL